MEALTNVATGIPAAPDASSRADGTPRSQLSRDEFYKIMIAEMSNQDPFEPLDNRQFLEQIASLQSLESTSRLTAAIDRLLFRQELLSASALIGKEIEALGEDGARFGGTVESLRIEGDTVKLVFGNGREVEVDRVVAVGPAGALGASVS
jgi:flagellar basal-body rod modification protein FlgD